LSTLEFLIVGRESLLAPAELDEFLFLLFGETDQDFPEPLDQRSIFIQLV
jgi:hypothetical protein